MSSNKTFRMPAELVNTGSRGTVRNTPTSSCRVVSMPLRVPDVDQSSSMGRVFNKVMEAIYEGCFIRLGGVVMIYSDIMECWYPLGSTTGLRLLSSIVGADNATVNYDVAVKPYVPLIAEHAAVVNVNHTSVCLHSCRWLVYMEGEDLVLKRCHDLVNDGSRSCMAKATLRQSPIGPRYVCTRLSSDHVCHVSARFSCLFESSVEYKTLLWVVGNSIVEPSATGRIVLLYGKGNNG
jgi:hypothetical protein